MTGLALWSFVPPPTRSVSVAEVMVDPGGICPAPEPKIPSKRTRTCSTGLPSTTIGVTVAWLPRAVSMKVSDVPV